MSSLVVEEATERAAALRSTLASRVVISDGAMGTMLQASDATLDDFEGHEGCNEVLNATRPDVIVGVHRAYLATGAVLPVARTVLVVYYCALIINRLESGHL